MCCFSFAADDTGMTTEIPTTDTTESEILTETEIIIIDGEESTSENSVTESTTSTEEAFISSQASTPLPDTVEESTAPEDGGVTEESTALEDSGVTEESTVPEDGGVTEESTAPEDGEVTQESTAPEDGGVTDESTAPEDGGVTEESTAPEDSGVTEESTAPEDSGVTEESTATEGSELNVESATEITSEVTEIPVDTDVTETGTTATALSTDGFEMTEDISIGESTTDASTDETAAVTESGMETTRYMEGVTVSAETTVKVQDETVSPVEVEIFTLSPVEPEIETVTMDNSQDREHGETTVLYDFDVSPCQLNDTVYSDGETVPSLGPCQHSCKCLNGTVKCERQSCPPNPPQFLRCSPVPTYENDQCCPIYTCRK